MRAHFIRGLEPKEAMNIGMASHVFAEYMIKTESKLKKQNKRGPIWLWWESYSGDFWDDMGKNGRRYQSDYDSWRYCYEKNKERALVQKKVLEKLLTIDEMPDDIDKWLWPGPNLRKNK